MSARGAILAAVAAALAALRFYPILGCYFFSDDFVHLFDVVNLGFVDFVLRPFGAHVLVVSKALMAALHSACGADPHCHFLAVLVLHAANVALCYAALAAWLEGRRLACFGAMLWGTAPVLAGSLGWYSVIGHVVLGSLVLALLLSMGRALREPGPVPTRTLALWSAIAVAGAASFGIGLGVAAAVPVLVFFAFGPARLPRSALWILLATAASVVALYFVIQGRAQGFGAIAQNAGKLPMQPEPQQIAEVVAHLAGFGASELLLGAWAAPGSYMTTAGRAVLAAAAALAAWAAIASRGRRLGAFLGLLLLPVACYVPIALSKAGIAAWLGVSPTTVAWEQRYHYVSLIPMTLLLCLGLERLGRAVGVGGRAADAVLGAWIAAVAASIAFHPRPIDLHDRARAETDAALEAVLSRVEGAPPGTEVLVPDEPFTQLWHLMMYPGRSAVFLIHYPDGEIDGRRVRFSVPEAMLETARQVGGRLGPSLVADDRRVRPGTRYARPESSPNASERPETGQPAERGVAP